ncbi:MAG: iron ABC transporter permease [Duncaniella sp.]|nr:iron ABC transporter permease [Duncaniella sp.]
MAVKFTAALIITLFLFALNLFIGAVDIPAAVVADIITGDGGSDIERFIILKSRLPMAITAALAGSSLAVTGLMLQTAFRNPLAGPSVLGVNSGASLGVAVVILLMGGSVGAGVSSLQGYAAVVAGAFAGSIAIMGVLIALSSLLRNTLMLLITGIMIGYLASSVIMLLNFLSTAEGVQSYVMWGMSSFADVTTARMPLFAVLSVAGLAMSLLLVKPLDILMLGDGYARNMGLNVTRLRNILLLATGLLTATITAFCGPVAFLGLSVPHIARLIFRTDIHRRLLPATMITGAAVALMCNILCVLPSDTALPLNAVTPLIGAPVVIWVLLSRRQR